jgi:hypothetical protein
VVVEKPTAGTGIIFDPSSLGSIIVSRRLDLSLFLSSNNTQTKSLLPCSLFMAKECQKPATEEMVVQNCITEKDLLEPEKPSTVVEEEGDLGLAGRED